jgi:hypothetical protein
VTASVADADADATGPEIASAGFTAQRAWVEFAGLEEILGDLRAAGAPPGSRSATWSWGDGGL